ncbi:MAG: zinc ribbon domain-containing protein [Clostridia bacterium]|nr:zinc ribbon domain-containing protein [Clostridia bacterium]
MDFFDKFVDTAEKAGAFIADKAVLAKDYSVASWNVADLRNQIEKHYKAIGELTYRAKQQNKDCTRAVASHLEELEKLHAALQQKEAERDQLLNKQPCPACGKTVDKESAFCPHCGAQMK